MKNIKEENAEGPLNDYDNYWKTLTDFIRYNPGARHRRRLLLEMLKPLHFKTLLDVGCGNAVLLQLLDEEFPGLEKIVGVDASEYVVLQNRAEFSKYHFHRLDAEAQALEEQFELVTCAEVVEHIENRPAAYENLQKMVAPGGHLLITCPTGKVYPTERHWGHFGHPSAAELEAFAKQHGLRVVKSWNWGWPCYCMLKFATNVNPDWAIKQFASGSYTPWSKMISQVLYWVNFANLRKSSYGCQLLVLLKKEHTS